MSDCHQPYSPHDSLFRCIIPQYDWSYPSWWCLGCSELVAGYIQVPKAGT
jgi:hypothetical protein